MRKSYHEWIVHEAISIETAKAHGYEELVRCEDCKWYDNMFGLCDNVPNNEPPRPREPSFYCKHGQRKNEDE